MVVLDELTVIPRFGREFGLVVGLGGIGAINSESSRCQERQLWEWLSSHHFVLRLENTGTVAQ